MQAKYKRILLKISGEVLAGEKGSGFDPAKLDVICKAIKQTRDMGVQIGLVVGGGNFWRGRSSENMNRARADHIGMLATVMNAIMLEETLRNLGVPATAQSAIPMNAVAEPFSQREALRRLEAGEVVIFGGGTGSPFFSTDTCAAIRAAEIGAEVIFKATNVDGVYNKDPGKNPDAVKYDTLTMDEVLAQNLKVMDSAAASLCRDNKIQILVFNLNDPQNIVRASSGENIGTVVTV